MKKLIFVEGKKDSAFLRLIIHRETRDAMIKNVNINNMSFREGKDYESNEIRKFELAWAPEDVLIKEEGGVNTLKSLFPALAKMLGNVGITDVHLLIDMDGRSIDDLLTHFNDCLNGRYTGNSVCFRKRSPPTAHSGFSTMDLEIAVNGEPKNSFGVIMFDKSLEDLAGISDDDGMYEIYLKFNSLLDDPGIRRPIASEIIG